MSSFEILIFLLKRKRYSIGIPFLAGVLGFVVAWIMPEYYKSEVRVLLDTGSSTVNISSLLKNAVPSNLMGALGGATGANSQENEDLYLEIIDGREIHLATIEKFRLDTIYKSAKYKETLIKRFYKDIKITVDELSGIISCSYEAKNKVLARDLVRFVVEESNAKYVKLKKERALQTLEQLNSFKQAVTASADSLSEVLVEFYRNNNLLDLESQMKLTIAAIASYEEQIRSLKVSESRAGSDNSTAADLRKRRAILEKELQKLRGEFSKEYVPSKQSVYLNSDWAVEKFIELQRMENDLRRLFMTLEMIEGNIVNEEANAARSLPVIQVVQDAYLPDYKSKPKRALWAIAFFAFSTIIVYSILIISGMLRNEISCEEKVRENLRKLLGSLV